MTYKIQVLLFLKNPHYKKKLKKIFFFEKSNNKLNINLALNYYIIYNFFKYQ